MKNDIVLRTTPKVKQVLDEWNKLMQYEKGVKVLKFQSDDMFAEMAKIKLLNTTRPELIKANGGRRRNEVYFKL